MSTSARPALDAECTPRAVQTLREDEPPPSVGAAFDDDRSLPAHSATVASYALEAKLDAGARTIDGKGTIRWKNASAKAAPELYFHLYLNAFKNNGTLFLRSPFGESRSGHGATHWGYIDVTHAVVPEMGGVDVWANAAARSTDDPDDETDVAVRLPRPVAPGETITIDVAWKSQLPEIVERTGYLRDFFMVGQWFPKLARREPDGTWVHFPFHPESEFYSDFGTYDVTLDVPESMVVGATGVRTDEHVTAGRRHERYRIDDVHDFAWTAWASFEERDETIDGVRVRVLFPPGNGANADATLAAVKHGLAFYGAAYGRYPYPVLTVVHPPEYAPAAGGMEYPTLITTGAPWYAAPFSSFVERITLHELGHQWFYGLVATDEHAWPFLDEGLTTYAESSAMRAMFGAGNGVRLPGLDVDGDAYLRNLAASAGHDGIVARPAAQFPSFSELGSLVYARTGMVLDTVARVWGQAALDRALGRYARRYRFDHPGPKHFIAVIREVVGDDAADFVEGALLEGKTVDFVAKDLEATKTREKAGLFDRNGVRETVAPNDGKGAERYSGQVLVYRHGNLRVPVDVELRFEDGSTAKRNWDGHGEVHTFREQSASPLVAANVDPDLRVLIDDDLVNNGAVKKPSVASRVFERATYLVELLLGALGP